MLSDEMRLKLMQILENNPEMSQRELARKLGVSLGRVNFCIQALIKKGLVKASNFGKSRRKLSYIYLLTPRGIEQKAKLTVKYLQVKLRQYESLKLEIERLKNELRS